jgi:hypothetical protein
MLTIFAIIKTDYIQNLELLGDFLSEIFYIVLFNLFNSVYGPAIYASKPQNDKCIS